MERKFIKLNLETMWWSWKMMFIFHQQSPEEKHSLACKGHNLFFEWRHCICGLQAPRPEQHKRSGTGGIEPFQQVGGSQKSSVVTLSVCFITCEVAHGA